MPQKLFFISFFLLLFFSCGEKAPQYNLITIGNLYQVELPKDLVADKAMHASASLQYHNEAQNLFVMCIEDSRVNDDRLKGTEFEDYVLYVERNLFKNADSTQLLVGEEKWRKENLKAQIRDYEAFTVSAEGKSVEIFYRLGVYESESHFFQLVIWCPAENHCERIEEIDHITRSLRLLESTANVHP